LSEHVSKGANIFKYQYTRQLEDEPLPCDLYCSRFPQRRASSRWTRACALQLGNLRDFLGLAKNRFFSSS